MRLAANCCTSQSCSSTVTFFVHPHKALSKSGVSQKTLELVHLRASQINSCSACVEGSGSNRATGPERTRSGVGRQRR